MDYDHSLLGMTIEIVSQGQIDHVTTLARAGLRPALPLVSAAPHRMHHRASSRLMTYRQKLTAAIVLGRRSRYSCGTHIICIDL